MTTTFLAEIDGAELACRIVEAMLGERRANGATAREGLETFPELLRQAAYRAARAAMEYVSECLDAGGIVQ